jgi:AmmeMemoRadiSam system protein A
MTDPKVTTFTLSKELGKALLILARKSICERFGAEISTEEKRFLEEKISSSKLQVHTGTFVTLTISKQLRGCIGSLAAVDSIEDGIKKNAVNAAFNDHRFSQLSKEELSLITIEISILTNPVPLNYSDPEDLKLKLQPGIDGVILKKGQAGSTFLPQVWDQLPRVSDFLSHLCQKAGLAADTWQTEQLDISTYKVQHFSE